MTLNACNIGFPNRNSHPPLLSKTSNSPCVLMPAIITSPLHVAFNGTRVLLAILSCLTDTPQFPRQCFTFSKAVAHMALTIAPSSKSALTHTTSPCGPANKMCCWKGWHSWWASLLPAEYKSMISNCSLAYWIMTWFVWCTCSTGKVGWSSCNSSLHTRTGCSNIWGTRCLWVVWLSSTLMTYSLFPGSWSPW